MILCGEFSPVRLKVESGVCFHLAFAFLQACRCVHKQSHTHRYMSLTLDSGEIHQLQQIQMQGLAPGLWQPPLSVQSGGC